MGENEIDEELLQRRLTVGVAMSGSNNSKYILKWALDKFIPEGNVSFKLIHVRPTIKKVPTPSKIHFVSLITTKFARSVLVIEIVTAVTESYDNS